MKKDELIAKNKNDLKTIGERIKTRRKELGLTQTDLAIKTGYAHASSIQKIEAGNRNLPTAQLESIANALFTSSSYLCGNESFPTNIEEKDREFQQNLMQIVRLMDDYEKAVLLDCARSIYRHSTERTRDELFGKPEEHA